MQYTKEKFLKDVKREAKSLRDNATKQEKERLDFENLNPNSPSRCIYGQMTGDCYSQRAASLISESCVRYFENPGKSELLREGMATIRKIVNGETVDGFIRERTNGLTVKHISAIETYIFLPYAKNKNLIGYIKGETKKLVL